MTDKPKKPRRQRVDSAAGIAAAIVSGGKKIALPEGTQLDAKERRVFTELCDEFSKSELTAHKIRLLVLLAQQMVMFDREQTVLAAEGFSILNANGNTIPNPRARACSSMHANNRPRCWVARWKLTKGCRDRKRATSPSPSATSTLDM